MQSKAKTVKEYLAGLPDDRREAVETLRKVINKNLNKGFEEGMQYGMPAWFVPHSVYPDGYHCDTSQPLPFASVASQKNHIGIYLMCVYGHPEHHEWFVNEWKKTGKKLDMGKSCVRVKKIEDVPLDVVGAIIKRVKAKDFIEYYEAALKAPRPVRKPTKKSPAKKTAAKKTAPRKKAPAKKAATKKKPARKKTAAKK